MKGREYYDEDEEEREEGFERELGRDLTLCALGSNAAGCSAGVVNSFLTLAGTQSGWPIAKHHQ